MPDLRLNMKRVVESRADAAGQLVSAGDAVLIERGTPRWLLLKCPCGCGDEIPINLDVRAGKAWRIYRNGKDGTTLYPSVWRDTGCGSHFILWRDRILLFGQGGEDVPSRNPSPEIAALVDIVRAKWPQTGFLAFADASDALGEVPWDVLDACRVLVRSGVLVEGSGNQRGKFRRV